MNLCAISLARGPGVLQLQVQVRWHNDLGSQPQSCAGYLACNQEAHTGRTTLKKSNEIATPAFAEGGRLTGGGRGCGLKANSNPPKRMNPRQYFEHSECDSRELLMFISSCTLRHWGEYQCKHQYWEGALACWGVPDLVITALNPPPPRGTDWCF